MGRNFATATGISASAFFVYCVSSAPAFAYLDAGTGSMILQVLLGGFAGLAMVGKLYWHRILVTLRIRPEIPAQSDTDAEIGTEPRTADR